MKSYKVILAAPLVLALHGAPAVAAADSALSGPAAAIAKARAAADQAERRGAATDAASAKAAADTPPDTPAPAKAQPPTADAGAAKPEQAKEDAAGETNVAARGPYEPTAHRDPFTPPRLANAAVADARTPLESYQLGQLKLVGVVAESPSSYRAMVEDSAGLGYIITTGTPIGSSGGVVRSIEPTRVIIEESTRDFYGEVKPKEVVMELPQEDRSP
jgi:Tfp pilus assembly protein PilP